MRIKYIWFELPVSDDETTANAAKQRMSEKEVRETSFLVIRCDIKTDI